MMRMAVVLLTLVGCTEGPAAPAQGGDERPPLTNGVSTLAGWSDAGDRDGSRDVNLFNNPVNVAVGPDGLVYVADFDNNKVRSIDHDGTTKTVIALPEMRRPFGLAFLHDRLIVQTDDNPDRQHSPTTGTLWEVDIAAGTAHWVARDIGRPRGLCALRDGRLALADYTHHVVQIFDPVTQQVQLLAGALDVAGNVDGAAGDARFSSPYALVQRPDDVLVVTDSGNNRLRTVTLDGAVATLPGEFDQPQGIAMAGDGSLYVTELGSYRVLRARGDSLAPVAGNGVGGYADSDDPLQASLYGLEGIAITADGTTIFVADGTRGEDVPFNRVRLINVP